MAQGELNTLGDREALQTRREAIQEELDRRRAEYDALGAALAALERAHSGLQARFSPALNRRAGGAAGGAHRREIRQGGPYPAV